MTRLLVTALLLPGAASSLDAQAGDVPGEVQEPLPAELALPPSPPLAPAQERATFRLPADLDVQLVAAEPLVRDPVVAVFDEKGRLWVVEMSGFMPDVEGRDERSPTGAVVVLSDEDGDGTLERRTPFLEGLVLPRAVLPCRDGALVIAPPDLLYCRDTDGDGRADERQVVRTGLAGIESPEHAPSGLLWTLDGWIQSANDTIRVRWHDDRWELQEHAGGGQWGLTRDDPGRLFFNTNSDPLRWDPFPSCYAVRNAALGTAPGFNLRALEDFRVFPVRPTPGVNRGYQRGVLQDGKLVQFTAACAPLVYRGDALPCRGNAFVCEPAANLIQRYVLEDGTAGLHARLADPGQAFLASTDERFRPVFLTQGPEGALYVVDFYRGILQHRIFMTTFLRRQILARGLDVPTGLGRIWRVVPRGPSLRPPAPPQRSDRVALLSHPDGFWRDTAQRLLSEEHGLTVSEAGALRDLVLEGAAPPGRMHALWVLEAQSLLDLDLLHHALRDSDATVRRNAMRVCEPWLDAPDSGLVDAILALGRTGSEDDRRQALYSLGEGSSAASLAGLVQLLEQGCSDPADRGAALSGLAGRESEFLQRVVAAPAWQTEKPGRGALLADLAACMVREGLQDALEDLLHLAVDASLPAWLRRAVLQGVLEGRPLGPRGKPGWISLEHPPSAWDRLARPEEPELADLTASVATALTWPGRGGHAEVPVRPLTAAEESLRTLGAQLYAQSCASCHQTTGRGELGKAPPLRGSARVLGDPLPLVALLLHGLRGPLAKDGVEWNQEMPPFPHSDGEIAAVLTYVRREWGHGTDPVAPTDVAAARKRLADREEPYTVDELDRLE